VVVCLFNQVLNISVIQPLNGLACDAMDRHLKISTCKILTLCGVSVCPIDQQRRAAGLLLSAVRTRDRSTAAGSQQVRVLQQMREVSC